MKSKLGGFSTILFLIGLVSYIVVFLGNDNFLLVGGVIISAIGFILALFAEQGVYKKIGLIGNGIIIFIAFVIPFIVTNFLWNRP
ncbi:hypothetical protein FH966_03570 [Lentibacillus cibarius]|uniref:Uncharacterized protein n=1 Tax=Lentibacillus cibarius TaxID=2583219 RepID=A0A549YG60_9BACI|nr:hypothetical protein [Lentibacillus cibarius]TRM10871.1 hypothetical protein FH966_03570 [Lentibacillus cibarius]